MNNFDWLEEIISGLPEQSEQRRNLIEISGYPSWENVNSNLLTFYFNETEGHGFGRLFFSSLLDLLIDHLSENNISKEIFTTPFKVERERNRIDILITGYEDDENKVENHKWAILIENKIHAGLYNDLKGYWKSLEKPDIKIGIALTLKPIKNQRLSFSHKGKKTNFVNLNHITLIESIKSNLPQYFQNSDDRHLLFLKEYIMNIESHYPNPERDAQFKEKLKEYQKYVVEIHEFEEFKKDLHAYCVGVLYDIMEQNHFKPTSSSKNIQSVHFYPEDQYSNDYKWIRFWMFFGNIESSVIKIQFQIYGDGIKYYKRIIEIFRKRKILSKLKLSEGKGGGKGFCHIVVIEEHNLALDNKTLHKALNELINEKFFNKKLNLIQEVANIIKGYS